MSHLPPPRKPGPIKPSAGDYFRERFLQVPDRVDMASWAGRAVVFAVLVAWGLLFIFHSVDSNYAGQSFLHHVNLVFHEAGHIVFRPFGRFISVLGGSLMQVLMPLLVTGAFLFKNRDGFGASVGLWWLGQNLIDMAPYIADARALKLPLLGGVTGREVEDYHDWEFILGRTGLMAWDQTIAKGAHGLGSLLILAAFAWGGCLLYLQFKAARQ